MHFCDFLSNSEQVDLVTYVVGKGGQYLVGMQLVQYVVSIGGWACGSLWVKPVYGPRPYPPLPWSLPWPQPNPSNPRPNPGRVGTWLATEQGPSFLSHFLETSAQAVMAQLPDWFGYLLNNWRSSPSTLTAPSCRGRWSTWIFQLTKDTMTWHQRSQRKWVAIPGWSTVRAVTTLDAVICLYCM